MGGRRLLLFFLLLSLLAGCAAPAAGKAPASGTASVPGSGSAASVQASEADPAYDLDLLSCGPREVYSAVFRMMNQPEEFIGKRIRMVGVLACYPYPDHTVYGCIIADATACCKDGMEFVLAEDRPENYPPPGSEIVVSGYYETYPAGDFTFCRLSGCRVEYVISTPEEHSEAQH